MVARKELLFKLLKVLVDEWGHNQVLAALMHVQDDHAYHQKKRATKPQDPEPKSRPARPDAVEQVKRAHFPVPGKDALEHLAMRYDRKQFLPSAADIREFYLMLGLKPVVVKNRAEAFRGILKALAALPPDRLNQLARSELHSGPSELGPLSDAISEASSLLPRNREPR